MTELNISPAEFTLEAYQGSIMAIIELLDADEEKVEQTKIAINANANMNLEVSIVNENGIVIFSKPSFSDIVEKSNTWLTCVLLTSMDGEKYPTTGCANASFFALSLAFDKFTP